MPVIDLGSVVGPAGPQGATGATGAQGLQGNPGPNQVTNQTSTNLVGVLQGSASRVSVRPFDSVPTADSTNLLTSGSVKTALDAKANPTQIAYVETGTTATRTYAVGELFVWNGLLYRASTAISVGASFTANTNCEQTQVARELTLLDRKLKSVQMFNLSQETGTTSALGNLDLSISPNSIIVATRPSTSQAVDFIGRGSSGSYYCHMVNSSGSAIASTSVTLDVYYVDP